MIISMTGFSSLTVNIPNTQTEHKAEKQIQLTMTLKSLNARFFEATCKLPYALSYLETDILKLFKKKLHRGTIYFTVHMSSPHALASHIELSVPTVTGYLKAIETLQSRFNIPGQITVANILKLPNIFEHKEEPLTGDLQALFMRQVSILLDKLCQARLTEGALLAQDITERIALIKTYLEELEPRAQQVFEQRREQFFQTLALAQAIQDPQAQAEACSAALYNIHEELVRFKTHLESLTTIVQAPHYEKGKKLDFTLQELLREINTLTAKSNDALLSSIAINIKVELEKAREQAQNIV